MNLRKITAQPGRRLSAESLERILEVLPIAVNDGVKLYAHAGLGNIIYIGPESGRVKSLKLGQDISLLGIGKNLAIFEYEGRKFELKYN